MKRKVSEEDFINLNFVNFVLGILKGFPDPYEKNTSSSTATISDGFVGDRNAS